ncbi:MAG: hydrolase 1, exosortase A system-associated [Gammaproteobacteria bacterium]|nr:hydrolase 1, exosortase A system-associated [Gammaproteobacteria bacterium]
MNEQPIVFRSQDCWLTGMIHHTCDNTKTLQQGVIIVVGGPQTRVGSHRQFVLLARYLARNGINVMRFDYAGIGDSEGKDGDFLTAHHDLDAAITQFQLSCPTVAAISLWGLCDAASVILLYFSQYQSPKIRHLILLNPWVEQRQSKAKVLLRHYYLNKMLSKVLWQKMIAGKFDFGAAIKGLVSTFNKIYSRPTATVNVVATDHKTLFTQDNFVGYMQQGLAKFSGSASLILSEHDLVAKEFEALIVDNEKWRQLVKNKVVTRLRVTQANHTFSSATWREAVEKFTLENVK